MLFQYNGKEVIDMALLLKKMHRSSLPNAVRFTLSDAAFDVKKKTLQTEVKNSFILRRPGFFKRFSGVQQAKGWNINGMRSSVGIINDPGVQATEDLAVQEKGGKINRSQIMLPDSRVSKSPSKQVATKYKAIGGFKDTTAVKKKDFVKAAYAAEGNRKPDHLRYIAPSGKGYMIEVNKITKLKKGIKIKSKIVASFENDRQLHLKRTPFVENASLKSANLLVNLFRKNAIIQLNKRR